MRKQRESSVLEDEVVLPVNHSQEEYFPFEKRLSIMTRAEQQYFKQLQEKYGEAYYIFPQVNLDKLVKVTDKKDFYKYFNKINRKSVDFVLTDKNTLETFKVIELDDYTHNWKSRKKRDTFVNNIFKQAGLLIDHEQR